MHMLSRDFDMAVFSPEYFYKAAHPANFERARLIKCQMEVKNFNTFVPTKAASLLKLISPKIINLDSHIFRII